MMRDLLGKQTNITEGEEAFTAEDTEDEVSIFAEITEAGETDK